MSTFQNILYVVEEPDIEQDAAIARAVSLAQNNQARLSLLYVADPPRLGPFADRLSIHDLSARLEAQQREWIEGLLEPHRGSVAVDIHVRFGKRFVEVVRDVLANGRDLVIKAAGYGGAHEYLFGGTDQHLLRKCPCPVWILYRETTTNYGRILAAVDFDPWEGEAEEEKLNRRILELASSLALSDFAELHVAHAWQSITDNMIRIFGSELSENQASTNLDRERFEHQHKLDLLGATLREAIGKEAYGYLSPRFHLRKGNPRTVIPDIASELRADLVVMGTVSRTGIPGFLIGNTAEMILNNIECSVLAVKPEGFVSPIKAK
jgi:nucleotide-binding universal stress UspA family protein